MTEAWVEAQSQTAEDMIKLCQSQDSKRQLLDIKSRKRHFVSTLPPSQRQKSGDIYSVHFWIIIRIVIRVLRLRAHPDRYPRKGRGVDKFILNTLPQPLFFNPDRDYVPRMRISPLPRGILSSSQRRLLHDRRESLKRTICLLLTSLYQIWPNASDMVTHHFI